MDHRNSQEIRTPRPSQTLGARRTAMRMMNRKSTGVTAVYEQDPTAQDAGTRTLIFEWMAGKAQVTQFPADWHKLSDDELAALRRAAG